MKLSVAKQGTPRYFTVKLGWKEQFDPKELEMLAAGVVPMLIPPVAVQGRRNHIMEFDVTAYTGLDFYLTCILSREQFAELLTQFVELFRRMQTVYLNYKNLVLDLDQIYVSLSDRSLHLVYLPLRDSKREASLPEFFKKLCASANRSTYEQVTFVNELTAFLGRPAPFTLNELEGLLKAEPVTAGSAAPAAPAQAAPSVERVPAAPVAGPRTYTPAPAAYIPAEPGGTVILQPEGGTVILGEEPVGPKASLVRKKTEGRVELPMRSFVIGKEAGQVDLCVDDNPAISRRHAEILYKDGSYCLRDLGSTNKSYLNGRALAPSEEATLADGDQVRLANEAYTFVLEK